MIYSALHSGVWDAELLAASQVMVEYHMVIIYSEQARLDYCVM